jgi:hypothetical protein
MSLHPRKPIILRLPVPSLQWGRSVRLSLEFPPIRPSLRDLSSQWGQSVRSSLSALSSRRPLARLAVRSVLILPLLSALSALILSAPWDRPQARLDPSAQARSIRLSDLPDLSSPWVLSNQQRRSYLQDPLARLARQRRLDPSALIPLVPSVRSPVPSAPSAQAQSVPSAPSPKAQTSPSAPSAQVRPTPPPSHPWVRSSPSVRSFQWHRSGQSAQSSRWGHRQGRWSLWHRSRRSAQAVPSSQEVPSDQARPSPPEPQPAQSSLLAQSAPVNSYLSDQSHPSGRSQAR